MDGNPYSRIVSVIRNESGEQSQTGETASTGLGAGPAKMRLGTVTGTAPLEVRVAGVTQPAQALRVNERLVKGAKWKVKLTSGDSTYSGLSGVLDGPVSCPGGMGSPSLSTVSDGSLHSWETVIDQGEAELLELDLEAGDQVLLLTEDDQVFYIIMKVVRAA